MIYFVENVYHVLTPAQAIPLFSLVITLAAMLSSPHGNDTISSTGEA